MDGSEIDWRRSCCSAVKEKAAGELGSDAVLCRRDGCCCGAVEGAVSDRAAWADGSETVCR